MNLLPPSPTQDGGWRLGPFGELHTHLPPEYNKEANTTMPCTAKPEQNSSCLCTISGILASSPLFLHSKESQEGL